MFKKILDILNVENIRSVNIVKHISLSLFYKGFGILTNFILVPLTLNYLTLESYGLWLTLSAFISWFAFFDVGLGNGLRNRFTESLAENNDALARAYVSSAYFTIGLVSLILLLVFLSVNFFIDWSAFFNADKNLKRELGILIPIVFSFFCIQLVVKLITTIYTADQKPSIQGKIQLISQVLSLFAIWLLTKTSSSSLLYFGIIFSALPVFVLAALNVFAFKGGYSKYSPTILLWKKKYVTKILGIGLNFFIIQMAALVLYSTDNYIISKLFGPEEVVPYNIAYKYFAIILMLYSIIVSPFWSSFTEAYAKKEYSWIRQSVKNIIKIWMLIPFVLVVMLFSADWFYMIWVGDKVMVPFSLNVSMAIFVLLMTFEMVFVSFINGVGKVKLQLYTSIVMMFLNIPFSIFLAKTLDFGVNGVILATCFSLLITAVLRPIQYFRIISGTAKGIWNQ